MYFAGLLLNMLSLTFLTFVYSKAITSDELILIIYLGVLTSLLLFWTFIYINKFVYLKIDIKKHSVIYSKLFYQQETDLSNLKYIKKVRFIKNVFRIAIDDGKFFFWTNMDHEEIINLVE